MTKKDPEEKRKKRARKETKAAETGAASSLASALPSEEEPQHLADEETAPAVDPGDHPITSPLCRELPSLWTRMTGLDGQPPIKLAAGHLCWCS